MHFQTGAKVYFSNTYFTWFHTFTQWTTIGTWLKTILTMHAAHSTHGYTLGFSISDLTSRTSCTGHILKL